MSIPPPAAGWPCRTARLALRPATPDDVEATWAYRRLPEVSEWMTAAGGSFAAYQEHHLDPERLGRTLVIEHDGELIGDLMLWVQDAWAQAEVAELARGVQAEVGWCLAPEHQGRGLAYEAVAELVRLCFEDLGLRRVFAQCFADNERSWLLMERLGMRREQHTVRESLHRSGVWLDGLCYAILADEWPTPAG